MSLTLLLGAVLVLGCAVLVSMLRWVELMRMGQQVHLRARAVSSGCERAQLQHPVIDLGRCMGVSACARECPVGAISVWWTRAS